MTAATGSDPLERRLRDDALACLRAAIAAVEPEVLVRRALSAGSGAAGEGPVRVVGIGKAARAMARGAARALGARLAGGVLVAAAGDDGERVPDGLRVVVGGHPIPDDGSVAGGAAVLDLLAERVAGETVLCLISGGGSALATAPVAGVSLADLRATTDALLKAGATIGELNAVRKHLDRLKGGRLARAAAPRRVMALVLSDVVGDPLDVIASGPVSPDPTTFADAVDVLRRRGVWERAPAAVRRHLERGLGGLEEESPKPRDPCFARVTVAIVGSNRLAAAAALAEAGRRGYDPRLLTTELTGEARAAGRELAAAALAERDAGGGRRACLVAAGETTVTVTGDGRGGRNQEVALGAALALAGEPRVLVASAGTDGVDGPTDAAGALADGTTLARAAALGLDAGRALAANDAYPFFRALGDLIVTGPTGTNVMDVQVALIG